MTELILANPRSKRKSRKGKMPAALKRYWASRRGTKSSTRRRKAPRRSSSRKRSSSPRGVTVVTVNRNPSPKKTRRSTRRFGSGARRLGSKIGNILPSTVLPAAIGAAGALALDFSWGYVPFLPDTLKTGPLAPVARLGLAVGLGFVAGKFAGRKFGQEVALGAVTVTAYSLFKDWLQANVPNAVPSAVPSQTAMYVNGPMGMGMYVDGRLGYRSPALISGRGIGSYSQYEDLEMSQDSFD